MKRLYVLSLLILAFQVVLFAQDYKVTGVEYLQNDMTARKVILTERVNGGQQCAVLRIATQNILDLQRDLFQFECDMGSVIRERRKDGGEICLWVSPDIKILKIKHNALGNYILNIPEMLNGNVQSLNTYQITIVGLQELPKETLAYGKCQMVFLPTPDDAMLFINGDSIGTGIHTITSLSGKYHWQMKHPLYHTEEGIIELTKGKIDSVYVNLMPAYGYLHIVFGNDTIVKEALDVYIDGSWKGTVPFKSEKLVPQVYEVTLKAGDTVRAVSKIQVKEPFVCLNQTDYLKWKYEKVLNIDKHLADYNRANNYLGGQENMGLNNNALDSLYKTKPPQYYPITGKVTIKSKPRAWVTIDNVKHGLTPVTIDSLSVGTHQLMVEGANYATVSREITVVEDNEMSYFVQLKRLCVATIKSDKDGDQVYIDDKLVGKTPVTIERPFGNYSLKIMRPSLYSHVETVTFSPDDPEPTIYIPLGQTVHIETGEKRGKLFLDRKYMGRAPMDLYLPNGQHKIKAEYGWKEEKKEFTVTKDRPIGNMLIEPKTQSMASFLSEGAVFLTGNMGLSNKEVTPIWGLNIGDIGDRGQAGCYISLMMDKGFIEDSNINNSSVPSRKRLSAQFGLALKVSGPLFLRLGAGYGLFTAQKNDNNSWIYDNPTSWSGFESSLGLQCHFYNIVVNADALIPVEKIITENKIVEFRMGLGFCLRHKR